MTIDELKAMTGNMADKKSEGIILLYQTEHERVYGQFHVKQDSEYISDFDRAMAKYLQGDKKTP